MMKTKLNYPELPKWLFHDIIGAEGEDEGGDGGDGGESTDGDNSSEGGDGDKSKESKGSGSNDDPDDEEDFKSAESKKRLLDDYARVKREKKEADRELAQLRKAREDAELKDKSEIEQAKAREEKATKAAASLAQGFLKMRLDRAVEKAAQSLNFRDADDAITMVNRSAFSWEQDEDDPSDIEIDEKSITREVKALAGRKPHLLKSGTDDDDATGGQFGRGGRGRSSQTDQALKDRYPSLDQ